MHINIGPMLMAFWIVAGPALAETWVQTPDEPSTYVDMDSVQRSGDVVSYLAYISNQPNVPPRTAGGDETPYTLNCRTLETTTTLRGMTLRMTIAEDDWSVRTFCLRT